MPTLAGSTWAMREELRGVARTAKQAKLLELAHQYAISSPFAKRFILAGVVDLLPNLQTAEQVVLWDNLRQAVFDFEFSRSDEPHTFVFENIAVALEAIEAL